MDSEKTVGCKRCEPLSKIMALLPHGEATVKWADGGIVSVTDIKISHETKVTK